MRSENFGDTIYEEAKSEVEDRIRRAQLAILNPSKIASFYLNASDWEIDTSESSFSKDCVTLEISGPDVADLSFCDLPGAVFHFKRVGFTSLIMLCVHRFDCHRRIPWQ